MNTQVVVKEISGSGAEINWLIERLIGIVYIYVLTFLYNAVCVEMHRLDSHSNHRPLQLAHATTAAQTPFLPHEALIDPLPHNTAERPVLDQAPRLLLGHSAHPLHLHSALPKHTEDTLVVLGERILLYGQIAFELAKGEVEGGNDGVIGLGGGCEDEASVWERRGTGEVVEEPFDECELVGVYWLIRVRYVVSVSHHVR